MVAHDSRGLRERDIRARSVAGTGTGSEPGSGQLHVDSSRGHGHRGKQRYRSYIIRTANPEVISSLGSLQNGDYDGNTRNNLEPEKRTTIARIPCRSPCAQRTFAASDRAENR